MNKSNARAFAKGSHRAQHPGGRVSMLGVSPAARKPRIIISDRYTIAKEPAISWMAVSRGPAHLPASRWKMKWKISGADVPRLKRCAGQSMRMKGNDARVTKLSSPVMDATKIENACESPTVIPKPGST